ncbi:YjjG family noncanonical pyrimidine nucleotidase [Isobaculum melis]|uniref:2-haloacid dehalogenase n=1 Tax=Isobaculum melis TaxID=142588 RepID=A0A1H9S7L9_9LACT|nr:YjjG family noncanonical pyrimidine nucleotidase [Isobaculum melis]SER80625.1 2-haloacid dehalogenase [Isobaculum melis]
MKTYQTLLFDIDDTLLDFQASEAFALQALFDAQQIPLTDDIKLQYQVINQGLWKAFEEEQISRSQVLNTRFSLLFEAYGQQVDGALFEKKYRTYLNQGHHLISGAFSLIQTLQQDYDLYVVTNGVSKTQYQRLTDAQLLPLFKDVFVSEDTGYQKPMKEYFDYVFNRIPHLVLDKTLIIGDSLTSDIQGGNLAGIDTCWFNPHSLANPTSFIPTIEIQQLSELLTLLKPDKTSI